MTRTTLAATALSLIFGLVALAGCAGGPEVKSIKTAPGTIQSPEHILVLAVSPREPNRNVMESALVVRLNKAGFEATEYGPAPSLSWKDPQKLKQQVQARLQADRADSVLTVSLVRKNKQVEHIPHHVVFNPITVSYGPLASATYMEAMSIPDTYKETTEYILRATLFQADSGASVWQMFSSTVNPESLEKAANEYARVVVRELSKSLDDSAP